MISHTQYGACQKIGLLTNNPANLTGISTTSPASLHPCAYRETNKDTYHRVYSDLTTRYASFDPSAETGFDGGQGLTTHIADITKKDLIGMLSHIRNTAELLDECQKNSSKAPFFDKFYLMRHPEQKWNLRLHHYNAGGNGLGGEDSPHYHRWTLASASLAGGYINVSYLESEKEEGSNPDFVYHKYALPPNNAQVDKKERGMQHLGEKVMTPVDKKIYAEGRLNHFPIEEPHSVQTFPEYFGSTLTLAHTSASTREYSPIFEKKMLDALPQVRNEDGDSNEFRIRLEREITFLQILDLKDELRSFLKQKLERNETLTPHEEGHFRDSSEANYVETSLLSTLAIYSMEKTNGVEHREFSPDTAEFLDGKIAEMGQETLEKIIEFNQHDLEAERFTVSVCPSSELEQLLVSQKENINPR